MALVIGSSTSTFRLISNLARIDAGRSVTLDRLSTGKRINRASDDPAGLIALSSLTAELAEVEAALDNNQRTKSMLDTADGALTEVNSLVADIERLAAASTGTGISTAEKAANQDQIDAALDAIDRIINNAEFNGKKLFGGENTITATMSTADAADLKDVRIHSRNPNQSTTTLSVNVQTVARRATTSGTSIANITANLSAATTLTVAGRNGTATVTVASGSTLAQVASTINGVKGLTGVSATSSGTQLKLTSTDYGSEAFVSIDALSGDQDLLATAHVSQRTGSDAVIYVNSQKALTSGTEIHFSGGGVSFSANLVDNTTGTRTITVTGGGATFQLGTDSTTRATIGLGGVTTAQLGRSDLGYLSDLRSGGSASLAVDANKAVNIVKKAVTQAATEGARVGGFTKYAVDSSINSLNATQEALSQAASDIGDTDFAAETAALQRYNLLESATISLLGLVNAQQANILALLG